MTLVHILQGSLPQLAEEANPEELVAFVPHKPLKATVTSNKVTEATVDQMVSDLLVCSVKVQSTFGLKVPLADSFQRLLARLTPDKLLLGDDNGVKAYLLSDTLLETDTLLKQPNTLHMCYEGRLCLTPRKTTLVCNLPE